MSFLTHLQAKSGSIAAAGSLMLIVSCGNITGLNGSSSYSCTAPTGVTCQSVSGTYHNAMHHRLPSQNAAQQKTMDRPSPTSEFTLTAEKNRQVEQQPSLLSAPLRTSARVLRLWFKPWIDNDKDMYDQGYIYVQIDNGRWLIDAAQQQIRNPFAPIRPPTRPAAGAPIHRSNSDDNQTGISPLRPDTNGRPLASRELPLSPSFSDAERFNRSGAEE